MILIPTIRRNGKVDVIIVINEDSIERMKRADPAQVIWAQLPPDYSMRTMHTISIAFCTTAEEKEIEQLSASGDPDWKVMAANKLFRGFEFRPDLGDHDFGPTVLGKPHRRPEAMTTSLLIILGIAAGILLCTLLRDIFLIVWKQGYDCGRRAEAESWVKQGAEVQKAREQIWRER